MKTQLPFFYFNRMEQNANALKMQYEQDGIIALRNVVSEDERQAILRDTAQAETDAREDLKVAWGNRPISFFSNAPADQSLLKDAEAYVHEPYFQQSDSKVHIFFEKLNGQLKLNRLGHGFHQQEKYHAIQKFIYQNPYLIRLLKAMEYRHPTCLLSSYIPKLPKKIGSLVKPHQESTFAHTTPTSCSVMWLALEDATIDNACMWGILGSNQYPLKYLSKVYRQQRRRDYVKINDVDIPPFSAQNKLYTPLEVRAGDALYFHGNFVHCSPVNTSHQSRKAMTFQFIESDATEYSGFNWIEKPDDKRIY